MFSCGFARQETRVALPAGMFTCKTEQCVRMRCVRRTTTVVLDSKLFLRLPDVTDGCANRDRSF